MRGSSHTHAHASRTQSTPHEPHTPRSPTLHALGAPLPTPHPQVLPDGVQRLQPAVQLLVLRKGSGRWGRGGGGEGVRFWGEKGMGRARGGADQAAAESPADQARMGVSFLMLGLRHVERCTSLNKRIDHFA
jgi:hypothetical protein